MSDLLEENLKATKKLEGGLFVYFTASNSLGNSEVHLRQDVYAVVNDTVYDVSNGQFYPTGDSLWNIERDCVRVGNYDKTKNYPLQNKHIELNGLLKLIGFNEIS